MNHATFRQPPAAYRPMPFWFWNGAMEPHQITAQIRALTAGGCGGFHLHPRQGLSVPYLSDRFLELTHDRYARHVGKFFGSTVPGIFTDEIEPPEWSPHLAGALAWRIESHDPRAVRPRSDRERPGRLLGFFETRQPGQPLPAVQGRP